MNERTDPELLRDYAEGRSEAAFAELVRRHVDLVHSAALRMVRDTHLAEDVTQGVFAALARDARQLLGRPVLSGWLHRTARNLAANVVRAEVRRRAREQEAATMNELLVAPAEPAWEQIAPLLDDALGDLTDTDRDAVLLRYFERKSARDMAQLLGVSDEAAQKRVTRAVDRLRDALEQRGVKLGAGALAVVIAANAVQAAPAGLAVTISTTATLAGAKLATTAAATTAKAIAMTTLQKALVAATITVLASVGVYEAREASRLRTEVTALRAEHAPLAEQFALLQRERDEAARLLARAHAENADLKRDLADLPRLRGEVTQLRSDAQLAARLKIASNDTLDGLVTDWAPKAEKLKDYVRLHPDKATPEFQFLEEGDWLSATSPAQSWSPMETELHFERALGTLKMRADMRFQQRLCVAMVRFHRETQKPSPAALDELRPFLDPATLQVLDHEWQEVRITDPKPFQSANMSAIQSDWMVVRKSSQPLDKQRIGFIPVKSAGVAPTFSVNYMYERDLRLKTTAK